MCKQEKCCTVVHNHYYNEGQQCGQTDEKCNSINYGDLQRFKGENNTDACKWEVGDIGQGFKDGFFGLYILKEIKDDGNKVWGIVRQSKDATL